MEPGLESIASLLRLRIGLEPASLGAVALSSAVRTRMTACKLSHISDYADLLSVRQEEFQELVEEMVVHESWFFRDVQPFECLRWFVRQRSTRPLRLLSIPCGGGEEAYSLAMTLLDCGLMPEQFSIEGIDISRKALQRAERASYPVRSFREADPRSSALCKRYLEMQGDGFRIGDELRSRVTFRHGNLAGADFLWGRKTTEDVIFCRNVLIYFTDEARLIAMSNLARLIDPEGMVYVGHAESRATLDPRFRLLTPEFPFALGLAQSPFPEARPQAADARPQAATRAESPNSILRTPHSAPPAAPEPLAIAQEKANAGQLDEAAALCEPLLQRRPPPVAALYLLGLIRQSQGRLAEARRCYDQVLYLDPSHHETLIHLALLAESAGDSEQAARYRRRAERAAGTGG